MTGTEIEPELNAIIAEKVMGGSLAYLGELITEK